jgi:hypothetical protein
MQILKLLFGSLTLYSTFFQILEEINVIISKEYNDLDYASSYFIVNILYLLQLFIENLRMTRGFNGYNKKKFLYTSSVAIVLDIANFIFTSVIIAKARESIFLILHVIFSSLNLIFTVGGTIKDSTWMNNTEPQEEENWRSIRYFIGILFFNVVLFSPFLAGGFFSDSWINGPVFDSLFVSMWNIQNVTTEIVSRMNSTVLNRNYSAIFIISLCTLVITSARISLPTDDESLEIYLIVLLTVYSVLLCFFICAYCCILCLTYKEFVIKQLQKDEENGGARTTETEEVGKKSKQDMEFDRNMAEFCPKFWKYGWSLASATIVFCLVAIIIYGSVLSLAESEDLKIFMAVITAIGASLLCCCICWLNCCSAGYNTSLDDTEDNLPLLLPMFSKTCIITSILIAVSLVISIVFQVIYKDEGDSHQDVWILTILALVWSLCCTGCITGMGKLHRFVITVEAEEKKAKEMESK